METKRIAIQLVPEMEPEELSITLQGITAEKLRKIGAKQGLSLESTVIQILEGVLQMQLVECAPEAANRRRKAGLTETGEPHHA
jgi:hypothetical protein